MSTSIQLISDFNIEVLARYLANSGGDDLDLTVETAPFGQVIQSLSSHPTTTAGIAVVWTRPEALFETYARALQMAPISHQDVLYEVDRFAVQLAAYAEHVQALLIPTWTLPPSHRGYGMLDSRPQLGLSHLVALMNTRLADRLEERRNIFVLDSERWLRSAGSRASAPKMWYASKVPFGNQVFKEAAEDIRAALMGLAGRARRLVVLDLDDTLWGGTVGESGWEGLALGGHDHVGEAYVDFQRALRGLSARGVQLAILSKNDEETALEAIDRHPEMILRRADFAGWRVNWQDKAANLVDLVQELNLGLESVVYIDDNASERGRIRESLPEVLVPDWPIDPALYVSALNEMRCFDSPSVDEEDRARTAMYVAERGRRQARLREEEKTSGGPAGSIDDWLRNLDLQVSADLLTEANLSRATQLFNKTNQMNMATRRLSESELRSWSAQPGCAVWTLTVTDRFGSSGLTGIVSVRVVDQQAEIVDFILSCRVMGRQIEQTMLHLAVDHARRAGATSVLARYLPTKRNGPCLAFWDKESGFQRLDAADGLVSFEWDARQELPLPAVVTLHLPAIAAG